MAVVAAAADLSLLAYGDQVAGCTRCALAETRTQVVFGAGSPTAELMFVGEAPGFHEDKNGVPFVGAAGKLLSKLLDGIGLSRDDVYICNTVKCRPPGNRNPLPEELEACETHLFRQIEIIQPRLVATLGNFATKLLSGKPAGITQVHGREQQVVARRPARDALPDLPSRGGALHAADAAGARGGFPPHPGAARARPRAGARAARAGRGTTVGACRAAVQLGLF